MSRICLLTDSREPSGLGTHMLTLASGLGADEIIVAAPAGSELLTRAAAAGHAIKAIVEDETVMADWLARSRPDVLHVHAGIGWEGHGALRAARAAGISVARTEHLPYLLTDPVQRAEHAEETRDLARLICVSEAVARSYADAGVDPALISTIPNGVVARPSARTRQALRAEWGVGEARVLLMAARFSAQKRHDLLLAALPRVLAVCPDCVLLLAGDGPLMICVAREVAARGLGANVRMLGARDDMADLFALSDLVVLPSAFEGLPLVLLEAMASGRAVVAADAPGNAEAVAHGVTGVLAAAEPAAFADAVIALLRDPERCATMGAAGRERQAARYSAERMISETRTVLREAADHTKGVRVERTRIGFIGAGGIAQRHLGVLGEFDDVEVVAVVDVDQARAVEAASRSGGRAFRDAAAMLEEVALDALFICIPPFAHGEPERLAIAHGLPFFVEKPIALDLAAAETIAAAVADSGLVTAAGYHWRYLDTVDEIKGLLAVTPARLMSGYWLDATPPPRWWWRQDSSGGQMVEQTTHLIDLARYLSGDVVRVYGQAGHIKRPDYPGLDVSTTSTATLTFASGAIANFASTCLLQWNHRVGLHLFGEGLAIELTDHDVMIDVGRGRPVRGNRGDPVWQQDRDFIDAVQGKPNRIRCPYGEALATLRLALAIERSAREGRAIDLKSVSVAEHV
jgi:predicted dehydrogenase/glycosyltransferase involved in cell wall biosynthesis